MTAKELLAEMLGLYDDPDSSAWHLHEWVHRHQDEIRGVVAADDPQDTPR